MNTNKTDWTKYPRSELAMEIAREMHKELRAYWDAPIYMHDLDNYLAVRIQKAIDLSRAAPASIARTDLLELAWGIIANAGGGDWENESKLWQGAAVKWRDTYFGSLPKISRESSEQPNVHVPPASAEQQDSESRTRTLLRSMLSALDEYDSEAFFKCYELLNYVIKESILRSRPTTERKDR